MAMLGLAGRNAWLAAAAAAALVIGGAAWKLDRPAAIAQPSAPLALSGRVVDRADILDAASEAILNKRLADLEARAGPQFVVATTPSLNGARINDYSLRLTRGWGIGDAKRNDGVLLLVAPNERHVRIEVGSGLEKTLRDPICASIIAEKIIPAFKRGAMQEGTLAGAEAVIAVLVTHPTKSSI
jgi:uncharacterized membrane protein YgcG